MAKNGTARTQGKKRPAKAQAAGEPRVEHMTLDDLLARRWVDNPKDHDLDFLGEAFTVNGFAELPHLDEGTGKVVAGHGRMEKLEAMRAAGEAPPERVRVDEKGRWLVPVVRGMTYRDPEKHLLASNRAVELGGWRSKELATILSGFKGDEALLGTGFDAQDVVRFMALSQAIVGRDPLEEKGIYDNNLVKQIVLYFEGDKFQETVRRLAEVMTREKLDSTTAVVLFLLERYEVSNARSTPGPADKRPARGASVRQAG